MYLSVLISYFYPIEPNGHFERSFAGVWILVCNVLLGIFTANLWDLLVRPQSIDRIDSWNDLYTKPQWKKIPIRTPQFLDMADFVMNDNSEMAQDFKKRVILVNPFEIFFSDQLTTNAIEKVLKGEEVFVVDSLIGHYYKRSEKYRIFERFNEGSDFHVSKSGAGMKPYFMATYPRFNQTLTKKLNEV